MCVYLHEHMCTIVVQVHVEKDIVIGDCALCDVGTRNWTHTFVSVVNAVTSLFGDRSSPRVLGQLQCCHVTQVSLELVVLLSLFLGWWQLLKWKQSILIFFGRTGLFKYLFSLGILAKFVLKRSLLWERCFSFRKLVGMIKFAATSLKLMIIRVSWMSWLLVNLHRFTL